MSMPSFVFIGFCYVAICTNIVMYGLRLFIVVLQELNCLLNCSHTCTIRGCNHFTKFRCSTTSGSDIAIYCCFNCLVQGLVIIVVCLLKSIPSFVLIGCCMSELHGHLCPYRNVLPEAVL